MTDNNFAQLTDTQLLHLFEVNAKPIMSRRLKQVAAELERRGYIFDENEGEFITCAQWNQQHADMPIGCNEQARLRSNRERDAQFRKGDRLSVVLGKLFAMSFRLNHQILRSLHVLWSVSRIQLRKTNALLVTGRLLNLNTGLTAFDTFVV